jgi:hypothetical protein
MSIEDDFEVVKHVLRGGRMSPAAPDAPNWIKASKSGFNGATVAWAFLKVFGFFLGVGILAIALIVALFQAVTN